MPTPSRPWRLVLSTPGAPIELLHRSKKAVYEASAVQQAKATDPDRGSRVTAITVEQWDVEDGRWVRYENVWRKGA